MSSTSGGHTSNTKAHKISWVIERDALRQYGDRRARAVLAIFAARRGARTQVFFVAPQIAALFNLTSRDLNWALDDLEGEITETIATTKGKFRRIRLLPQWEDRFSHDCREQQPARHSTSRYSGHAPWGPAAAIQEATPNTRTKVTARREDISAQDGFAPGTPGPHEVLPTWRGEFEALS